MCRQHRFCNIKGILENLFLTLAARTGVMPTIRTIINDLYNNHSMGIGRKCDTSNAKEALLSDEYYVKKRRCPVTVSFGDAPNFRVNSDPVAHNAANGFYLYYRDRWSTVATITRARRIVLGGDYSGCLYSVYKAGRGVFKCIHTYRSSQDGDYYVDKLRTYAANQGWTLVHEVPTVGAIGVGGCTSTFIVTRVSYTVKPNPIVRTIRLRLNNQGLSVARDRWDTPTPT